MNGIVRPMILPKPVPKYQHAWSVYPDTLIVSFKNGKTVKYVIDIQQPEPVLGKMLDRFAEKFLVGGYKYKEKGKGKHNGGEREELL